MGTDALVKVTKGSSKEDVVRTFACFLPTGVHREAVEEGKDRGHPDALRIEENVRKGILQVVAPPSVEERERTIRELGLTGGEADALRLFSPADHDLVASDDRRFLHLLEGLGIPFVTPAALVVALARRGAIRRSEAREKLDALAPWVSEEEYLEALRALEAD